MTEGHGPLTIRSFTASLWWVKLLMIFGIVVIFGLAVYSVYAFRTMNSFRDQGLELELMKSDRTQKVRQIEAIGERLEDLDRRLGRLRVYEDSLQLLSKDFNRQLGLPDTAELEKVWPALTNTVAWTWGGANGQGGQDPSLTSYDVPNPAEVIKGLHQDLDRLEENAAAIDLAVSELTSALEGSKSLLAATPYSLPMIKYRLTSGFGYRRSPFGGSSDLHQGLDLAAPPGTMIYAPADGLVLSSDWSNNGYGLMVTLDHGFGLSTRYAHLSESLVTPGQKITRGQPLAKVGSTGRSTGPHLHYETVLGGVAVDPLFFARSARDSLPAEPAAETASETSEKAAGESDLEPS
ncbi:MAG: M23 family metallopeptidase [Deltaproteobacteria bacterium]|jgi:murein DD-endopeptidase MepM/ murein hydrolase activator NlpD|nr:M23 family metallopeptidase [Deltaproteobacteria bacterium]